jgi:hypothetical protein
MVKSLEAQANHVLLRTKYTGQSKGFTFDRFISTMEHAFNDCGVACTESQKVTILLNSIADTTLGQTKHAIKSCKQMKNNFSEAVAYFVEELASRTNTNSRGHRNVSSFGKSGRRKSRGGRGGHGGRGGRGSGKKGGGKKWSSTSSQAFDKWDPAKPGAYYSYKAFHKFTPEQRAQNKQAREQAGIGTANRSTNHQLAELKQQMIATLTSNLEVAQAVTEHQSIGAAISGERKRDS